MKSYQSNLSFLLYKNDPDKVNNRLIEQDLHTFAVLAQIKPCRFIFF
ncbi:MAG: hypothetical protein JWP78_1260 [Mucilaginibacter sp.]|nr:hypothetical protein [Mucilaginibacter sp.]